MFKGRVFVRLQPVAPATDSRYNSASENSKVKLAEMETLFQLEQWLNGEIAQQAFSKFKVGLRIHVPTEE